MRENGYFQMPAAVREKIPDRLFSCLLLAITLAALIPRLVLGVSQFIHYDGYWHIFIATQDRWNLFVSEWKRDAHPPLHYLLLRVVAKLGHSHLTYRWPSIIPGVAAVYVMGALARKRCDSKIVALLTAAAYGFSITMIDLTCDVRSYPLALLFVICAFYYFVDILDEAGIEKIDRSLILFGVFTTLAIFSEYYSILFLLACIAVLLFNLEWIHARWYALAVAFGLPACAIVWLYFVHLRLQPSPENNVIAFHWTKGTPVIDFVLRNLQSDLNYMLPVEIGSTVALIVFLLLAIPLLLYFIFSRKGTAATPALVLLLLAAQLIVLSLIRRYPFGGYARQQSILFPFLTLTAFVMLDWILKYLSSAAGKIVLVVIAVSIVVSFSYQWHKFPKISEELFTRQYKSFQKQLAAPVVYVDQYSLIAYYIHTHTWNWRFRQHVPGRERIDEYEITSPSGADITILRDLDEWNFDLLVPDFYKQLASALASAGLSNASLFLLKQVPNDFTSATVQENEKKIQLLADAAGLTANPVVYTKSEAFVSFALKP